MIEIPLSIAFILDGNRRWAKTHNMPALAGHTAGFERLEECVRWVRDRGIKHMAAYVFSSENWNRHENEISDLMNLFRQMVGKKLDALLHEGVAVHFVGNYAQLPSDIQDAIKRVEEKNPTMPTITVWVCVSYGAKAEIVNAANEAAKAKIPITEESLRKHMWTAQMPDPDLVIRTGGEQRLSNFLLWQSAYSELFFIKEFWPDFSEKLLDEVLEKFAARERRLGK